MAMAKFTFDGPNKLFIAKAGVTSVNVQQDLYSDWKEHVLATDDVKFPPALRAIGGDPVGGGNSAGRTFFLQNGFQLRPDEADHTLIIDGNLYHDDGLDVIVPTLGGYTVLVEHSRSNLIDEIDTAASQGVVDALMAQLVDGSKTVEVVLQTMLAWANGDFALTDNKNGTVDVVYKDQAGDALYTLRKTPAGRVRL